MGPLATRKQRFSNYLRPKTCLTSEYMPLGWNKGKLPQGNIIYNKYMIFDEYSTLFNNLYPVSDKISKYYW